MWVRFLKLLQLREGSGECARSGPPCPPCVANCNKVLGSGCTRQRCTLICCYLWMLAAGRSEARQATQAVPLTTQSGQALVWGLTLASA